MPLESNLGLQRPSKFSAKTRLSGPHAGRESCTAEGMAEQRTPGDFDEVLCLPEQPLIVGGQAVNIWADFYSEIDARLEALKPFVSKDADVFGDRAMAERLAAASKWRLTCYYEPRSVGLAMLTKELPNSERLTVEIISSVNGLTPKELADPDIIQLRTGKIYRLPSPIVLLKAKLANVAQIDQSRRQDVRHVRMLIPCTREYLRGSHVDTLAGRMSGRDLVNLFEAARSLCLEARNAELGRKHDFNLADVFPMEFSHSPIVKVARFYENRMTGLSRTIDPDSPSQEQSRTKAVRLMLESMISPSAIDKDREKTKGPEIEMD